VIARKISATWINAALGSAKTFSEIPIPQSGRGIHIVTMVSRQTHQTHDLSADIPGHFAEYQRTVLASLSSQ
jgi:translation elongation factor EF-Tu-like GTPase